jgi:hypothetical protein
MNVLLRFISRNSLKDDIQRKADFDGHGKLIIEPGKSLLIRPAENGSSGKLTIRALPHSSASVTVGEHTLHSWSMGAPGALRCVEPANFLVQACDVKPR